MKAKVKSTGPNSKPVGWCYIVSILLYAVTYIIFG